MTVLATVQQQFRQSQVFTITTNNTNSIVQLIIYILFRSTEMCAHVPIVFSLGEHLSLLLRHPDQPENPRLIRVAVVGAPNAGKSTLTNQLLGRKVNCTRLYIIAMSFVFNNDKHRVHFHASNFWSGVCSFKESTHNKISCPWCLYRG